MNSSKAEKKSVRVFKVLLLVLSLATLQTSSMYRPTENIWDYEPVEISVARGAKLSPLVLAAMERNAAKMNQLLEAGANPNAFDDVAKETTILYRIVNAPALMWDIDETLRPVVVVLLEHGADPRIKMRGSEAGKSAIDAARANGNARALGLFEEYGWITDSTKEKLP